MRDAKLRRDFRRFASQRQRWPPALLAHDLQIHPAHPAPPARSQRLHPRFFCGKPPRVAFIFVPELFAVFAFFLRVQAPQKRFAVALDRRPDAVDFGNVHSHPDNQGTSRVPQVRPDSASDYTGRVVTATKTLRTKGSVRKQRDPARAAADGWTERTARGLRILQASALAKLPWLVHGFSTRPGGVSELQGEKVLNLGFAEWDSQENVLENRRCFQSALGADDLTLVTLRQIHSDVVQLFEAPPAEPCRGDASATNRASLLLAVQTADCVPILLVDPRKRAVAAVHAGWRGTLLHIVTKTIGTMYMQFGTKPADLLAAIGPSIGGCCYEVGTEVAAEFKSQFPNASDWFDELRTGDEPNPLRWLNMSPPGHQPPPKNVLLDLRKANCAQLLDAGLRSQNIFVSDLCTACRRDLLFSYRKEGAKSGRHLSVIGIRKKASLRRV